MCEVDPSVCQGRSETEGRLTLFLVVALCLGKMDVLPLGTGKQESEKGQENYDNPAREVNTFF